MRFFKDFVTAVDENASKQIIDNMCNVRDQKKKFFSQKYSLIIQRPQTCDSVMSEREAARPPTATNVVLPRYISNYYFRLFNIFV
jgi:hypothetical protein